MLTAEELRTALVTGVLDRLQLPPLKISYKVNSSPLGVEALIREKSATYLQ